VVKRRYSDIVSKSLKREKTSTVGPRKKARSARRSKPANQRSERTEKKKGKKKKARAPF